MAEPGWPPAPPERRILGVYIKKLDRTLRRWYLTATDFTDVALQKHKLVVPQGRFWEPLGGTLTRGVCTCTAVVTIRTKDDLTHKRLLVLASGSSDTTDIPDNALRNVPQVLSEGDSIYISYSVNQNSDSNFKFSVLEGEAK